jgi:DNA-directed RNA polymerase specialized sigma24 family protein
MLDETPMQQGWFNTTLWTVVLTAGREHLPESSAALEQLCRTYWPPLYAYIRRRGYNEEDAKDLTQALFSQLLEKNVFASVDRNKGKFRSFLLASANNVLANEWDRAKAKKRGGDKVVLSLDDEIVDGVELAEPRINESAELFFDRRWAFTVLQQSVSALEREFQSSGKGSQFEKLRRFLTEPATEKDYAVVAADLQTKPGSIAVAVYRLRQRYRELVRAEIANTVSTPAEIDEEMQYLLKVLGS